MDKLTEDTIKKLAQRPAEELLRMMRDQVEAVNEDKAGPLEAAPAMGMIFAALDYRLSATLGVESLPLDWRPVF